MTIKPWTDRQLDNEVKGATVAMLAEINALRAKLAELEKEATISIQAKRLALELECLLLSTKDAAAQTKWWDTAHEALAMYRDACDEVYK